MAGSFTQNVTVLRTALVLRMSEQWLALVLRMSQSSGWHLHSERLRYHFGPEVNSPNFPLTTSDTIPVQYAQTYDGSNANSCPLISYNNALRVSKYATFGV